MTASSATPASLSGRLAVFAALLAAALVPFALCDPLPLNDYPNHLARMHILADGGASPDLARYYGIEWSLVPNLAVDLVVPLLARLMPVETAMLVFSALIFLLTASGTIAANWALYGGRSWLPFGVFLLLYNRSFLWGFLNYLFALGVAFWAFALWLWLKDRGTPLRLAVFPALAFLLFVLHLSAFGVYAILVGGYELHRSFEDRRRGLAVLARRWAVIALQFVPPFIALLALSPASDKIARIEFGSLMGRLVGVFDPVLNYVVPVDLATAAVIGGVFVWGLVRGWIVFHRLMIVPTGLLVLLYAFLPDTLLDSFAAARRLALPLAMAALVACDLKLESVAGRRVLFAGFAGLFALRLAIVAINWQAADAIYAEMIAAMERLERGARIYTLNAITLRPQLGNPPLQHMPAMAVVRRDALTNQMFTDRAENPIHYVYPPEAPLHRRLDLEFKIADRIRERIGFDYFADADPRLFDYILVINPQWFTATPPASVETVYRSNAFALYRIRR
jgi:hypothetical protein